MRRIALALGLLLAAGSLAWAGPNVPAAVNGCVYNSTPPSLSDGQTVPFQCNTAGALNIAGSISASTSATATSTLPSLSSGSNAIYEDLFGGLYVQPEFAGQIVDGTHGLPVNVIASTAGTTATATSSLPSLTTGSNNFYEDLTGGLFVQPIQGGAIVSASNPVPANTAQVNGTTTDAGNGTTGNGTQRVTLSSDSTGQVKLATGANTIGSLASNQSVNVAQVNGNTTDSSNGVTGLGTQRVTISSDSSGQVKTTNWPTTVDVNNGAVSASTPRVTIASDSTGQVKLATGANTIGALLANQSANITQIGGDAVATSTGAGGTGVQRVTISNDSSLAANQSVNVAQMNGSSTSMGNGTTDGGTQRVTLSSDSTGIVGLATGSNVVGKVGVDQTTPGTTNAVQPVPGTSNGLSSAETVTAATTNATSVKGSAGMVYSVDAFNATTTAVYIKLYDTSTTPNCNTDTVKWSMGAPAAGGFIKQFDVGLAFTNGIAYCITNGITNTDNTAVDANAATLNIGYK